MLRIQLPGQIDNHGGRYSDCKTHGARIRLERLPVNDGRQRSDDAYVAQSNNYKVRHLNTLEQKYILPNVSMSAMTVCSPVGSGLEFSSIH